MSNDLVPLRRISRRQLIANTAFGAFALASAPILHAAGAGEAPRPTGPASRTIPLDGDWLFGGAFKAEAVAPDFDDSAFSRITLPHCAVPLSWRKWDADAWQQVYIYRRHLKLPDELKGLRAFLHFDGVMVGTTPTINGHTLAQHLGGYLPFQYEITQWIKAGENVLAVAVDSRWSNVPPQGSPNGPKRIDYLEPGGILRPVRLRLVPGVFIADLFAKSVNVLDPARRIEATCSIDAVAVPEQPMQLRVELRDGERVISREQREVRIEKPGQTNVALTLANVGNIELWDINAPRLYDVVATLLADGKPIHDYRVRIGFREARFDKDGFFLNGRRLRICGLNRHEIYPYVGGAMPRRVMRRDAEILRREFNCNVVRCSHYPQSEAFLDACDELGLMVWEEVPGWGFIGDDAWKELLVRDVGDMVRRDRNHPSIIVWGVRVNESANDQPLYRRTRAVAKSLDDSRPTSGSMVPGSRRNWKQEWHEDVFAFDDYHAAPNGSVAIDAPLAGVPYMLAETVGQFNYSKRKGFDCKYRRAGDIELQQQQALRHAQAHSKAAAYPRFCGTVAWCAFDYASLVNPYDGVKCPGVADVFRIPKLGATFYLAQGDAKSRPVILPNFYWDFGQQTPRGPGKNAAVFSNCDRLELFINGQRHATLKPDATDYPHIAHPPFFADLEFDGTNAPELRIDGYVGDRLALSRSFSSDPRQDQLSLAADDAELIGDGMDATRLVFARVDKHGNIRPFSEGDVSLRISGPGVIVGDNRFNLADSGGAAAVWVKSASGGNGRIEVTATHSQLGAKTAAIKVSPAAV